jgi:hypothetical protein
MVKIMAMFEQMTFDLMGLEKNAYESHFGGLSEDAVLDFAMKNKITNLSRGLYQKIRYVKYMCGDMDAAAKHYDLQQQRDLYAECAGQATTGELGLYLHHYLRKFIVLSVASSFEYVLDSSLKLRSDCVFLDRYIH